MIDAIFENIEDTLISIFKSSQSEIKIAVSWFTNIRIYETLIHKLGDGVRVTILINNDEVNNNSNSFDFNLIINNGGKVYFMDNKYLMHNKFAIIDNEHVITGSYNYTDQAEKVNIENILIVRNDILTASAYSLEFSRLLMHSSLVEQFERIERDCRIEHCFKPIPSRSVVRSFCITKVNNEKRFITLKGGNGEIFYLNTSEKYEVGAIIELFEPLDIETKWKIKNSWLNVFNWIRNPKIKL